MLYVHLYMLDTVQSFLRELLLFILYFLEHTRSLLSVQNQPFSFLTHWISNVSPMSPCVTGPHALITFISAPLSLVSLCTMISASSVIILSISPIRTLASDWLLSSVQVCDWLISGSECWDLRARITPRQCGLSSLYWAGQASTDWRKTSETWEIICNGLKSINPFMIVPSNVFLYLTYIYLHQHHWYCSTTYFEPVRCCCVQSTWPPSANSITERYCSVVCC